MSIKMTDAELAEKIRELLMTSRKSQMDVSRDLGVPYRSVQKYMSGETRIPATFLIALCRSLDVELDYLVTGDFRPRQWELFDAVIRVLDDLGVLAPRNNTENATGRAVIAGTATATIRESYDRFRREALSGTRSSKKGEGYQ